MIYADSHMHSIFSEDVDNLKGGSISMLCEAAIENGLSYIAVTDHLEIDAEREGTQIPLDISSLRDEIYEAKEKYKGKLELCFGVELGQACHYPEDTERALSEYDFEFIIGSCHAIRGLKDFYYFDYENASDQTLVSIWQSYIEEMNELTNRGGFDTLAHITYPLRYYKKAGKDNLINIKSTGRECFEPIFKKIIEKGISLEVNTSGLRQNHTETLPGDDLIAFYRSMGGRLVTVGSDAHFPSDVGAGIKETYKNLAALGFTHVNYYVNREIRYIKL